MYEHKHRSFPLNRAPKMWERQQLFFGLLLVSEKFQYPEILTKIVHAFGGFFHQIIVRQPIGRKDSIQTAEQAVRWIHFCMKRLRTLKSFQIFKTEIKH